MAFDSRAVKGESVIYEWHGEHIDSDEETTERKVADWFALRCANELLNKKLLGPQRFNKFRMLLSANVEEMLLAAAKGQLTPGSDVIHLARSKEAPAPMFEFHWGFHTSLLPGNGRQALIRHYDAEPEDRTGVIFGLLIHRKDVSSGDDGAIHAEQDDFITAAIETCSRCAEGGWVCS